MAQEYIFFINQQYLGELSSYQARTFRVLNSAHFVFKMARPRQIVLRNRNRFLVQKKNLPHHAKYFCIIIISNAKLPKDLRGIFQVLLMDVQLYFARENRQQNFEALR